MTWTELLEEIRAFTEKEMSKPIRFYFNGGEDKNMALVLSSEDGEATLKYVNESSEDEVKNDLEICTPYFYIDESCKK